MSPKSPAVLCLSESKNLGLPVHICEHIGGNPHYREPPTQKQQVITEIF
uniref:Uncharacterized protein n=1 Tax=Tetraselmis sp. GSL018 TaxID=582737 RepID=A0A061R6V3_9CHLO